MCQSRDRDSPTPGCGTNLEDYLDTVALHLEVLADGPEVVLHLLFGLKRERRAVEASLIMGIIGRQRSVLWVVKGALTAQWTMGGEMPSASKEFGAAALIW